MKHVFLALLALWALSGPAHAAGDWDLDGWLDEPDVKLVAVEFYADWCVPCKASAPRWEALRKKYAADGLKLVVVNLSESPGGGGKRCTRLPWNPDESLCDPELGEKLGVTSLPEAFLWSWQGNLLVQKGQHVDEIERIIRRYLDDNPRVQIAALGTNGQTDKILQRQVEAALGRSGKLTVVPDAEMQKRLAAVRKASHGATKRDDQRCAIGAEVSPNSLLTAERFEGALSLTMADAESGCQRAVTSVPWDGNKAERTVEKAVYKLMSQMKRRGGVEMPEGSAMGKQKRKKRAKVGVEDMTDEEDDEWVPEEEELANVKFTSEPTGARVLLDGELLCPKTPCRRDVEPGRHQVSMELARYETLKRRVNLEPGQMVGWSLKPTFATLSVHSTPSGVEVTLGGESIGTTPIDGLQVDEGKHTVVIGGRCYKKKKQRLKLPRGKSHTVNVTLKTRPAGLNVRAVDEAGDAVEGDVYVDGERVGQTPKTFSVGVCAKEVEVRHDDYGTWSQRLDLKPKKTFKVTAELSQTRRSSGRTPFASGRSGAGEGASAFAELERLYGQMFRCMQQKSSATWRASCSQKYQNAVMAMNKECIAECGGGSDCALECSLELQKRTKELTSSTPSLTDDDDDDDSGDDYGYDEWVSTARLDLGAGLTFCAEGADGSTTCGESDPGPGFYSRLGFFYDFNPYVGLGVVGDYSLVQLDETEMSQLHAAALVKAYLPVNEIEFSFGIGLGYSLASLPGGGEYDSEWTGVTVPISMGLGLDLDGMIFGLDLTIYTHLEGEVCFGSDCYPAEIPHTGQFGLYVQWLY